MLIDPLTPSSDPQVFTGSYNWTSAGNATNDENSVIIHDATITNEYYQSFCHNFTDVGGAACPPIVTGIETMDNELQEVMLYPNPFADGVTLRFNNTASAVKVIVYDQLGRMIHSEANFHVQEFTMALPGLSSGMYLVSIEADGQTTYKKIVK